MAVTQDAPAERRRQSPWRWLFVVALLAYLLAATYQLHLPGVNYDEVLDAVPAMQSLLGQPVDSAGSLHLFGRDWPLMTMPYIGGTTSYLLLPGFAVFGIDVAVLRLTTIAVGLLSLVLMWGFLREFFDERAAALAVLLMAVNPTYVFWSRMGAWVAQPLLPITLLALWMLFRWYRSHQQGYLVAAAFFMGFGLTTKLLFLWAWVALALAWLVLSPWLHAGRDRRGWRRWLWPLQLATPRGAALALLALIIGLSPVIIYNLQGGLTYQFFRDAVLSQERTRLATLQTLRTWPRVAWADLGTLLDGTWFRTRLGGPHANRLAAVGLALAVVVIVGFGLRRRLSYSPKRAALLGVLLVSIVAMSSATSISQGAEHLLILWPIPQALIAVAVFSLADNAAALARPGRLAGWLLIGFVVAGLVAGEAWTTFRYHRTLAQTGGIGHFSDAIYALADDLERAQPARIIALDWGFKRNLQFLSQGRLAPEEWFTYGPPGEEAETYLNDLVPQPGLLYLLHAPRYTAFPGHRELFDKVAYRYGLAPVVWKSYSQRDGEPVFQVYTFELAPPLAQLPAAAHPLNASLGDGLRLLGFDLPAVPVAPGETLQATLYWQAQIPQNGNYKVFAHLVDDSGKLWAQHDAVPRAWGYPTTQWQAGEIVADRIWLPVRADAPPGVYHLLVGMYDEATGRRLAVELQGQSQADDALPMADVRVGRRQDAKP